MQYRLDKKGGAELSVLGFGCMRLPRSGAGIDMGKSEKVILNAIERGVNYFDTAYIYPGSEAALGKILAASGLRDKVFIATKMPIMLCKKTADFERFFRRQLMNLRTDHVDYYLMHNINSLEQWQALCDIGAREWISEKLASGEIHRIGFSFHGIYGEFTKLVDSYSWDFCYIQYNYSDENYQAGTRGLKYAAAKGLSVMIMEPLLGGKLATGLPKEAVARFKKENPELSPAAWALRWLLDKEEISLVLSGMNSASQLDDNIKTTDNARPNEITEIEREAYADVLKIFKSTFKINCTGCGYCLPCPQKVNIPGCFAAYNNSFALRRISGFMQYTTGTAANRRNNQMASRCTGCGKCEAHCPQNIEIRKELGEVRRRMEPAYYRAAMKIVRLVQAK